jgi:hypothetical protein
MTSIFTSRRRRGDTEIRRRRGKLPYWDRFTSYSRSSRAREHLTGERALSEQQTNSKREPRPARGSRPVRRPPLRYLPGGEIISYTMSGTDTRPLNLLMNAIECIPSYAVIARSVALYLTMSRCHCRMAAYIASRDMVKLWWLVVAITPFNSRPCKSIAYNYPQRHVSNRAAGRPRGMHSLEPLLLP